MTGAATAGPGQNPASPQPTPNSVAPPSKRVQGAPGRQHEAVGEDRARARKDQAERRDGDQQRAVHDERQGRIPSSGDVEEADHLGRVHHARDDEPQAEERPGDKSDERSRHPDPH